ncbi:MAG: adenosylmethionine--8-amino-7-oxononanoate transaminase [Chitinophagales bacterium]|nr:adenosylmethionine--8-amino-7-oxononanoate transaminase [Chitinophagales bacterium]MDW8274484.1 adenosylmethionine--8-amino-7-oxononanoate transaminase [Chitinophagales bacterium]
MNKLNLSERDARVLWHPYTQMKIYPKSIAIVEAKGCYLYDEEGKKYLDAISSWWVNIHGHCHPHITEAISKQVASLEQVIFAGFTHQPAVSLAEKLLPLLPARHQRLFLSDNGSTAVEAALKMAIQYFVNQGKPRHKFIAFRDAYHGDTFGSMSVSARSVFTAPFHRILFDVLFVDTPSYENEQNVIVQFKQLLQEYRDEVCAFIYEPLVLGSGGMFMYSASLLQQLLEIAKDAGILCIADEVMTGFGRTGTMFASERCSVYPDIICLSKGITGGFLPLGATTCTEEIFQIFWSDDKSKMLFHGHSYTGNALACAAACASLEVWEKENTRNKIRNISQWNEEFLEKLKPVKAIQNLRSCGTITAMEVCSEKNDYLDPVKERLMKFYLEKGILLRPLGNTIYILPPYCITKEELSMVFDVIANSVSVL